MKQASLLPARERELISNASLRFDSPFACAPVSSTLARRISLRDGVGLLLLLLRFFDSLLRAEEPVETLPTANGSGSALRCPIPPRSTLTPTPTPTPPWLLPWYLPFPAWFCVDAFFAGALLLEGAWVEVLLLCVHFPLEVLWPPPLPADGRSL